MRKPMSIKLCLIDMGVLLYKREIIVYKYDAMLFDFLLTCTA